MNLVISVIFIINFLIVVQYSKCSPERTEKLLKKIYKDDDQRINILEALALLPEKIKNKAIVLIPIELLIKGAKIKKDPFRVLLNAGDGNSKSLSKWNEVLSKIKGVNLNQSTAQDEDYEETTEEPQLNAGDENSKILPKTKEVNLNQSTAQNVPFRVQFNAGDGNSKNLSKWSKVLPKTKEVNLNQTTVQDEDFAETTQEPQIDNVQISELIGVRVKFENSFFNGQFMKINHGAFLGSSGTRFFAFMSDGDYYWTIRVAGKSDSSDENLYFIRTNANKGFDYLQMSKNVLYDQNRRYVFTQNYKQESLVKTKREAMWFIRPEPDGSFTVKNAHTDEYLIGAQVNQKNIQNLVLLQISKVGSRLEGDEILKRQWKITLF